MFYLTNILMNIKKISFTFNFNWANIILFSFFLCYGYYGAITFGISHNIDFIHSLFLVLIQFLLIIVPLIVFAFIAGSRLKKFDDSFTILLEDVIVFLFLFLFLFFALNDRLNFSLFSDEISYVKTAHGQSIYMLFILEQFFVFPANLNFQYLVQFVSFGLLAGIALLFFLSNKLIWKNKVILITTILVIGRFIFVLKGGNQSPHPPIHLIPSFIFGSLFGVRDIFFKIGHLFIYSIFLTYFYKLCRVKINVALSSAITLSVCTLPIAFGMSSDIEHSIWSYYFIIIIMMELVVKREPNLLRLVCLVSIGALMRQPIFLTIIPIIYLSIKEGFNINFKIIEYKKYLIRFAPLLLFLPFLLKNILYGLADNQFDFSELESDDVSFFFSRIIGAFDSGGIFKTVFYLFPIWLIAMIPFAFIGPFKWRGELSIPFFLLFITLLFLFYSIAPGLWGMPKYQVEITAPFIVLGIVNFIFLLNNKKINKVFLFIMLISLSVMNIFYYSSNIVYSSSRSSITPFNYSNAYKYIDSQSLSAATYSIGSTYGIMPEIMNGYSSSEIFSAQKIYSGQRNFEGIRLYSHKDITSITDNSQILAVLIGFTSHKNEYIDNFLLNGWKLTQRFNNGYDNNSDVVILERK
tara:strand:+ start:4655 stop:6559 length:1905 start_codon:yes stop_codon:yes gene_type:complete